ncbi:MAG TPA: ribonuclease P protein component [Acidimicrobiia bacterium]|nr:ribonuclease P protein component [Acidimicrobiia bacterium]
MASDPTDQQVSYQSLRNSRDFRRVFDDGTRRRKGGIVVVSSPAPAGPPRLGLVVSKACGTAVTRNRIKRRLRAAAATVELKPGNDYVIIATSQVADAPFARLTGWLERAVGAENGY